MPPASQYLYQIRPTRLQMLTDGPTDAEAEIISQHFDYLQRLMQEGVVILAGRTLTTDEQSFGIVIFNATSEEAALALMNNDPAVRHRVMDARLFPYRVALIAEANAAQSN
jgi:uncharacterized protein